MNRSSVIALLVLFGLLAAPFAFRRDTTATADAEFGELIIITPHNEQIRYEFGRAFSKWAERETGERVKVVWTVPGGTTDIRRALEAQFIDALRDGRPVGGSADLVFGGGMAEHERLKRGVSIELRGERRAATISAPVAFGRQWLLDRYGGDRVGHSPVFDSDGYWFGVAVSGFGVTFNRDALHEAGVPPPADWGDLANPRLRGWVSLGNPAQSGSIAKSFDTVLQQHGWEAGWRIIRRMAANARSFAASSSKVPIDVGQGDAAAGVCIDFYGRFQSQAIADSGDPDRVGYVDAPGMGAIDPDPVSMLRGAPHPDFARRFIEFCLTEEAQSLWQIRRDDAHADGLGTERYELRRLPITRRIYDRHFDRFVDRVNPFEFTSATSPVNPTYGPFVALVFSAMAMDDHNQLRRAWEAIIRHPAYPSRGSVVTAEDVEDPTLASMLRLFDAMPDVPGPDGARLALGSADRLAAIQKGWIEGEWRGSGLWNDGIAPEEALRLRLAGFFRDQYREVVSVARDADRR